ncbi:MAG: hypothetical protein A3H29_02765 [Acidobacteria bacterium RIFCSPLOWO2_02_FULL_67_21]|nr:MAG: hypothetical protein A3H29_02765 [Acidobacteria bacterium RIFCSPLOWO2_02_FULL_67_21]
MITGAIKSQSDQIWKAFWSGGISNPLEVIEQIAYLLFLRRLPPHLRRALAGQAKPPLLVPRIVSSRWNQPMPSWPVRR